jgi:translation initiation factor IF-3
MDYGKFKYESAVKARESRKNQTQTVVKEIKLRPKIDPHDYGTKKGHVERFLKAGDKVKVTIMFRGREQSRPELGFRLLQRLAEDITELGYVESSPKQDGRNMVMVLAPTKKKADARAEQRRRRELSSMPAPDDATDAATDVATDTVTGPESGTAPAASAPAASAPAAASTPSAPATPRPRPRPAPPTTTAASAESA